MTNAETHALVLKDGAGEYYLLPIEALKQLQVPEERKAEVEQLIAESDDVQGHEPVLIALGIVALVSGFSAGFSVTREATRTGILKGWGE